MEQSGVNCIAGRSHSVFTGNSPPSRMESRRTFLAGSLAAGTVAVAGCGGILGDDGDEQGEDGETGADGADNSQTGGSLGRYADLIADTGERPVTAIGQKLGRIAGVEDFGGMADQEEILGVAPTEIGYSLDARAGQENYAMLAGPFEFESVVAAYEDRGGEVSEAESYGGFRTIETTLGPNSFFLGLDDGLLVNAGSRERYELAIDRLNGEQAALLGSGTALDDIGNILGDPDIVLLELEPEQLQIDPTGTAVAGGASLDIAEGTSGYTAVVGYETEAVASENESAVGDAAVEAETALDSVDTTVEGRFVVVRGDATTADL